MSEIKRTEIATLGEFGLIDHLTKAIELKNKSSLKGVGDDAAVLDYASKRVLVTTDLLLEGIHFDLTYVPLKHLGYKSAESTSLDIYAIENGQPKQITVSLGISKRFSIEDLDDFYEGLHMACEKYGVDIVGGDTSSSLTGMAISITCIGEGEEGKIVYRNGARRPTLFALPAIWARPTWGCSCWNVRNAYWLDTKETQPRLISGKNIILERQLNRKLQKAIIGDLARKKG